MIKGLASLLVCAAVLAPLAPASAASKDEDQLVEGCDWLERAIAREPERDDAFGMFMRGMRPKCQAMLEGLARKDNSVRPLVNKPWVEMFPDEANRPARHALIMPNLNFDLQIQARAVIQGWSG